MRIIISIGCDNNAFQGDNLGAEAARILREMASDLDTSARDDLPLEQTTKYRDINGNACAFLTILGEDK